MVNSSKGRLFVFEGPDDVGKTTLAGMLSEHLSISGRPNEVLSFPGREPGTVSELIYRLYHDPTALGVTNISHITLQVMVTAAHIEVITARVKPLINAGVDVVLDRFWWSTWVYATVEGVPASSRDLMIQLEKQSWLNIKPEIVFLVLAEQPFLPQPLNHPWREIARRYKELFELQKHSLPTKLIRNEGTQSEAFRTLVSMLG